MNSHATKAIIVGVVLLVMMACGGGGGSDRIGTPSSDADNDGLTNEEDTGGWEVWPDRFGLGLGVDTFGQMEAHYPVTSDPEKADTDGDGLDDHQEFLINSDPRMIDTDGDGLTDEEEFNRWGTSAVSIDSDGDSRGPDGDLSPNPKLFDAAELKIDLANDSTHTPGIGATSPVSKDTDGDRWSDYYEIIEAQGQGFNPVIADRPTVGIEVAGPPMIYLNGSFGEDETWNKEVSVTTSESLSRSVSRGTSRGTETILEHTIGGGVELGWEGAKFVGHFEGNYSFSTATSNSQSVAWGQEQTRTAERTYQESHGEGGGESVTLDGGELSLPVDIVNTGNITYTLKDLTVTVLARYLDDSNDYAPVMEIDYSTPLVMAPGEKLEKKILSKVTDSPDLVLALLKNPSGLIFEVSGYTLTDEDDVAFDFNQDDIKQKTAMVVIDYGAELPPERYLVAVSPCRNPDLTSGVTLAEVMSGILEIPYETMPVTDGADTYQALSTVRTVSHDDSRARKWLVAAESDSLEGSTPPDFDDIVLQAGDSIYLIFVTDEDGDGLAAREEFLHGTSDREADTDGDGLTDYQEVREGWTVKVEGEVGYTAFSRGYSTDSDSDGLSDDAERACGLDPIRTDTDLDRIDDLEEIQGFDITQDGDTVVRIVPYEGKAVLDGGDETLDSDVSGTNDELMVAGPIGSAVDNGAILIRPGTDGSFESTIGGDDYEGVEHDSIACAPNGYATNPLDKDTDGDRFLDGLETSSALGNPNNPEDGSFLNDEDNDGLSDRVETTPWPATVNGRYENFSSDPNDADSDDDGLPDGEEFELGTNPQSTDTDGDGLSDDAEIKIHNTKPTEKDSDNDTLADGIEINGWTVEGDGRTAGIRVYTDPLNGPNHRNEGGLNDYDKWRYKLDPNAKDTDGDIVDDFEELNTCTDYTKRFCRDPGKKDRMITVELKKVAFKQACEKWFLLFDEPNEVSWYFELITPGDTYSVSGEKTQTPPINWFPDNNEKWKWSFIATYGEEFEVNGYIFEWDYRSGNSYFPDQSMCFGYECDPLGFPQDDVQYDTKFIVGEDPIPSQPMPYSVIGKKCGILDCLSIVCLGDRILTFDVEMAVKITSD